MMAHGKYSKAFLPRPKTWLQGTGWKTRHRAITGILGPGNLTFLISIRAARYLCMNLLIPIRISIDGQTCSESTWTDEIQGRLFASCWWTVLLTGRSSFQVLIDKSADFESCTVSFAPSMKSERWMAHPDNRALMIHWVLHECQGLDLTLRKRYARCMWVYGVSDSLDANLGDSNQPIASDIKVYTSH